VREFPGPVDRPRVLPLEKKRGKRDNSIHHMRFCLGKTASERVGDVGKKTRGEVTEIKPG